MTPGWRTITPPAGAFDPAAVRITPVGEVRAGDLLVGTIQPYYGPLLEVVDRAQWVSYFAGEGRPQSADARPFDPAHCDWCGHNAYVLGVAAGSGRWTVDGCTTYRPDSLLLVVPRELADWEA
jgi:hypothetical protein